MLIEIHFYPSTIASELIQSRDVHVAKVFNRLESSNDRQVFGPNAYSQRCISLDFGGKVKGIQDRLLSGNK